MSNEPPETTPAAGWYEDPNGPGLRWWDGSEWTEHTLDEAPEMPAQAAEAEAEPAPEPAQPDSDASGAPDADALMAMYGARPVGIKRERDEQSYRGYKGLIAILVLGLVAIVAGLLVIGGSSDDDGVTLGGDPDALQSATEAQSFARTAQTAIETYATDRGGDYSGATPEALVQIEPTLSDAELDVTSDASSYTVTVTDPEGGGSFSITRDPAGGTTFSCASEGSPGCPPGGDWTQQQPL